jgi:hypothetical protein
MQWSKEDRATWGCSILVETLSELAKIDERKTKTVELRYFGGLSVEEAA